MVRRASPEEGFTQRLSELRTERNAYRELQQEANRQRKANEEVDARLRRKREKAWTELTNQISGAAAQLRGDAKKQDQILSLILSKAERDMYFRKSA